MGIGISKQLNYNLYTNAERAQQVRDLFTDEICRKARAHFDEPSTQQELETIANFILYGKDPHSKKNFCQKKEIQIKAAHSSYQKKDPLSLEAFLEDPTNSELEFQPITVQLHTKNVKPVIDREADAQIPGMRELWGAIDRLAKRVAELKEAKELGLEYYRKNHMLIELRKEQFALKDAFTSQIQSAGYHFPSAVPACLTSNSGYGIDWVKEKEYAAFKEQYYKDSLYFKDRARMVQKFAQQKLDNGVTWEWKDVSENQIDLEDPTHIYGLLENYSLLKENSFEQLGADARFVLWELEECIEKAKLDKIRFNILVWKIDKVTNSEIARRLYEDCGTLYSDNYISTIYKQTICREIAAAATLLKDEWTYRNQPEKFKTCTLCGKTKLRDNRNFIKKASSPDGLAPRCKECDKQIRDARKEVAKLNAQKGH